MLKTLVIAGALALAGCGSTFRYTGDEYYYTTVDGTYWSCREPLPYKGGNCLPEKMWPDNAVVKK